MRTKYVDYTSVKVSDFPYHYHLVNINNGIESEQPVICPLSSCKMIKTENLH